MTRPQSFEPPAVSIVMPTRNQAAFIVESIDSVMAQQVPGALELVVADGASTDGTVALLEAAAQRHGDRLHWISEPDAGPADAVNKAVARARAPVIGWLNSDDLYTDGAVARALQALDKHAGQTMVYGEGEHIDERGASLGRYPTRSPGMQLSAWAAGCPICQPTAFFRRDAFLALGGLDTRLKTAFDFEFWLRLARSEGAQIGFVPALQARSRLHVQGITLRMREQVAMEALEVLHRHLGSAPGHWLLTHAGEALAACPFERDVESVRQHLRALADQAAPWLGAAQHQQLLRDLRQHRAWMIARDGFVADVHADGWASPSVPMRLRQPVTPYRRLRLWGRHAAPHGGALELRAEGLPGDTVGWRSVVPRAGAFELTLPLPPLPSAELRFTLHAAPDFVPGAGRAGGDQRRLAFLLDAVELK